MATELAKAYVQIIPSAQGIKGKLTEALGGEASSAGNAAGLLAGTSLVSKIKTVLMAAGFGKVLKESLLEGADLQQALGGIETLFKDSANTVIKNAQNAYQTAGMSANQYMENVTSFSASLLQGLGGDTAKAAEIADMALKDMSDNANKFGSDMESITMAYQGFAKGQYQLLDNLKLGYGGTKTEMQRLLADAQKLTGVKYDINNLSDVYEAIHVIQEEMGVTGTTALEASATFTGSLAAMKAAASNFLGSLALGENVTATLSALGETVYTFIVGNLIPMVANFAMSIGEILFTTDWIGVAQSTIERLATDLGNAARERLGTDGSIVDAIIQGINAKLPEILTTGYETILNLVTGILNSLPQIISSATTVLTQFITCIVQNFPQVLSTGVNLILNLVNGIIDSLPEIISSAITAVGTLLETILTEAPKLIEGGLTLIGELLAGILEAVPDLIGEIPGIIDDIKTEFTSIDWGSVGKNIIDGIAAGIANGASAIISAAKEAASRALQAAKDFLGIHSPSKVFENQVGAMVAAGFASGIDKNAGLVTDSMKGLTDSAVDSAVLSMDLLNSQADSVPYDLYDLGNYIIRAVTEQGKLQADALKQGIEGIKMIPDEREVNRYIASMGFARG